MKRIIFAAALTIGCVHMASAELYDVSVTRVDQDLYKTLDGTYIKTQYCYVYTNDEETALLYSPGSYENKIAFFNSDEICQVVGVFK